MVIRRCCRGVRRLPDRDYMGYIGVTWGHIVCYIGVKWPHIVYYIGLYGGI